MARSQFPKAKPTKAAGIRKPRPLRTHVCQIDGRTATWDGDFICAVCDMPRSHRVHDVTQVYDEARVIDERRGGE